MLSPLKKASFLTGLLNKIGYITNSHTTPISNSSKYGGCNEVFFGGALIVIMAVSFFSIATTLQMRNELIQTQDELTIFKTAMSGQIQEINTDVRRYYNRQLSFETALDAMGTKVSNLASAPSTGGAVATIATAPVVDDTDLSTLPQPGSNEQSLTTDVVAMAKDATEFEQARIYTLTSHFDEQGADDPWVNTATSAIDQAIESEELAGAELQFESKECKDTVCKVVVVHEDSPDEDMAVSFLLPSKLAGEMPKMATHREQLTGGRVRTTMYLSRRGEQLPQPQLTN